MKVIVLTSGEYSAYTIHGVFSSKRSAERFVARAGNSLHICSGSDDPYDYEEYELDGRLKEKWQTVYHVTIDLDGNLNKKSSWEKSELVTPKWSEVQSILTSSSGFAAASSISKAHALKLCAEQRQAWLREFPNAKFCWISSAKKTGPIDKPTKLWYGYKAVGMTPNHGQKVGVTVYGNPWHAFSCSLISSEDAVQMIEVVRREVD